MKKIITIFLINSFLIAQSNKNKQVDQLFKDWDNKNTPGAAVAIVKDDKRIKIQYGFIILKLVKNYIIQKKKL